MLNRVLDFIVGRQPVQTATGLAALITAGFGLAKAFGVLGSITPEQVAAIAVFVTVVAGWLGHRAVSPVTSVTERQINRLKQELANEAGGVWAAICITFAIVFLLLFGFCVMAGDGEVGEKNSMARTQENNPCKGGDCSGRQGDCREVEKGGYCEDNDLSPSFQDSPVDHSFNPVICVLPDSCRFEGQPQGGPA